jgi:hypothetical protein
MKVIPGSHRQGRFTHMDAVRQDSLFGPGAEIEVDVDETKAVCVALAAGETSSITAASSTARRRIAPSRNGSR